MTAAKAADIVRHYRNIKGEYAFHDTVMDEDDTRVRTIKHIMRDHLTEVEKTIFILYLELQSYRKLGQELGCSHQTIKNEVKKIKTKILLHYGKNAS